MSKYDHKNQSLRKKRDQISKRMTNLERLLRGSIVERFKKCGKPGCHCLKGKGHGPAYYLSITLAVGKTRSYYLPARLRRLVAQYLKNHRRLRELSDRIVAINLRLLELGDLGNQDKA